MKSVNVFILTVLLPCIEASFPGSTFGITYNTTSTSIPASGHLKTFNDSSSSTLTTISDTPDDLGAFFAISGPKGYLRNVCNDVGTAALVPVNPPVGGLSYVLQWTTEPYDDLPAGSNIDGFVLGPPPTYDTLMNDAIDSEEGGWVLARLGDINTPLVVGWSETPSNSIPIVLVKAGTSALRSC